MKDFIRPTLVRRVVLALLTALPLVWLVLISSQYLTLLKQWGQDGRDFASTPIGQSMRRAFGPVDKPEEVQAIAAAFERLRSPARGRGQSPIIIATQLFDRRDQKRVFSSPELGGEDLHGDPGHETVQRVGDRTFLVYEVDTPRWRMMWARTRVPSSAWLVSAMSADLLPNLALAFPCFLLPAWIAVRQGLRPVRLFSDRIAARGPDDLTPIGIHPKHAELKPLGAALDELIARLRRKVESEQAFVANAAHELRTPLAVISAQAHVLAKAASDAERTDAQNQMEVALHRASHLVHQLLSLARMEMEQEERSAVDVAQLVRQEIGQLVPTAMQRQTELSLDAPDKLVLTLEVHPFRSILQNLIDNAIRYGQPRGRVEAEVLFDNGILTLSVSDDGPGITQGDRLRVFDRFYRGTGHDLPGTGLGLTIVKQAALRMGGDVRLTDGLDRRGCRFTVRIPGAMLEGPYKAGGRHERVIEPLADSGSADHPGRRAGFEHPADARHAASGRGHDRAHGSIEAMGRYGDDRSQSQNRSPPSR